MLFICTRCSENCCAILKGLNWGNLSSFTAISSALRIKYGTIYQSPAKLTGTLRQTHFPFANTGLKAVLLEFSRYIPDSKSERVFLLSSVSIPQMNLISRKPLHLQNTSILFYRWGDRGTKVWGQVSRDPFYLHCLVSLLDALMWVAKGILKYNHSRFGD